ncbi:hypothetical protein HOT95_gp063 [Vibrio phage vB_VpS_PG07]|uniref:Uncharacterized protein n=1 Tax=Vibrio phage vB_VpS_PG07 TaxID=2301664 RepID=A0A385E7H4_9CAUD|nr:hypothetical protein HOT95_gp063 [Vibrio phage vB_VpS_PG07]AXQ66688.1 hypothetical protein [Vibrio phage vB_VpS_PG07]
MFKLLIKFPLVRKIYRAFVPLQTSDSLAEQFTGKFTRVVQEQNEIAKEYTRKEVEANARRVAAEKEAARAAKAAKNFQDMLEKE